MAAYFFAAGELRLRLRSFSRLGEFSQTGPSSSLLCFWLLGAPEYETHRNEQQDRPDRHQQDPQRRIALAVGQPAEEKSAGDQEDRVEQEEGSEFQPRLRPLSKVHQAHGEADVYQGQ